MLGLADSFYLALLFFEAGLVLPYYLIISFAALISLFDWQVLRSRLLLTASMSAFILFITFFAANSGVERLMFLILHFFILLKVIHMLAVDLLKTGTVNSFFVVLVFYELLTLAKFFNLLTKMADISILSEFHIITGIQIVIGIFFTIFTNDDRKLRVKLE